jgi:threonine synthase
MVSDPEVIEGIQLLAETEGIFTEPAGGVTVAATRQLIERGAIPRDESIVICITGNGYKTIEVLNGTASSRSGSAAASPTSRRSQAVPAGASS